MDPEGLVLAVTAQEAPGNSPNSSRLVIEISLLSPPEPMRAASWAQLVRDVRPGVDGVIVRTRHRQGVFLPSVWDQLPDPVDFVDQLYRKADLAPRSWPRGMQALRFTAAKYSRRAGAAHHA